MTWLFVHMTGGGGTRPAVGAELGQLKGGVTTYGRREALHDELALHATVVTQSNRICENVTVGINYSEQQQ